MDFWNKNAKEEDMPFVETSEERKAADLLLMKVRRIRINGRRKSTGSRLATAQYLLPDGVLLSAGYAAPGSHFISSYSL